MIEVTAKNCFSPGESDMFTALELKCSITLQSNDEFS